MIDFELDEEQQLIKETVTAFAADVVRPAAHDADETGVIPEGLVAQAWELGIIQNSIPEEYGGYGSTPSTVTGTIVAEGLAEGDLGIALHLLSARLVVDAVMHAGSDEQKKEVLPLYCTDKFVSGSAAVLEPQWNFSLSELQTSAKRDGNDYVISGTKCYVPLAKTSPYMVVFARGEEEPIEAFLLKAGTPGVEIGEREGLMGIKACETYPVAINDVRVPASAKLPGSARGLLRRSRVAQSAMAVGVAKASLDYAIEYAKEREAFGVKIAQKQAIAFMLADMAIDVDAARLLNWEAAWSVEHNEDPSREITLARSYTDNAVMTVTDNGVQVLGGHGFIREHPVEMWARNGRGFSVFEGMASV